MVDSPLNMNFTKENGEFDVYADHVELDSEKNGDVNNQNFGLDQPEHVWFNQVTKNGDLVTKKFYIFIYQVVPSTRRGGSFENRTWL